jgi:hypothetical protein
VSKHREANALDEWSDTIRAKCLKLVDDSFCELTTFLRELKICTQKKLCKQNLILEKKRHFIEVSKYNLAL